MLIEIDFSSDEAIYQQLCNQIILGIATSRLSDGEVLPSVRQMADEIGITVISSPLTTYTACGELYVHGLPGTKRKTGATEEV